MIEDCGKSIYVLYKSEQKKDDYQWSSQVHIHIYIYFEDLSWVMEREG